MSLELCFKDDKAHILPFGSRKVEACKALDKISIVENLASPAWIASLSFEYTREWKGFQVNREQGRLFRFKVS